MTRQLQNAGGRRSLRRPVDARYPDGGDTVRNIGAASRGSDPPDRRIQRVERIAADGARGVFAALGIENNRLLGAEGGVRDAGAGEVDRRGLAIESDGNRRIGDTEKAGARAQTEVDQEREQLKTKLRTQVDKQRDRLDEQAEKAKTSIKKRTDKQLETLEKRTERQQEKLEKQAEKKVKQLEKKALQQTKKLAKEATKKAQQLEKEATKQKEKILEEAQKQAEKIRERADQQADKTIERGDTQAEATITRAETAAAAAIAEGARLAALALSRAASAAAAAKDPGEKAAALATGTMQAASAIAAAAVRAQTLITKGQADAERIRTKAAADAMRLRIQGMLQAAAAELRGQLAARRVDQALRRAITALAQRVRQAAQRIQKQVETATKQVQTRLKQATKKIQQAEKKARTRIKEREEKAEQAIQRRKRTALKAIDRKERSTLEQIDRASRSELRQLKSRVNKVVGQIKTSVNAAGKGMRTEVRRAERYAINQVARVRDRVRKVSRGALQSIDRAVRSARQSINQEFRQAKKDLPGIAREGMGDIERTGREGRRANEEASEDALRRIDRDARRSRDGIDDMAARSQRKMQELLESLPDEIRARWKADARLISPDGKVTRAQEILGANAPDEQAGNIDLRLESAGGKGAVLDAQRDLERQIRENPEMEAQLRAEFWANRDVYVDPDTGKAYDASFDSGTGELTLNRRNDMVTAENGRRMPGAEAMVIGGDGSSRTRTTAVDVNEDNGEYIAIAWQRDITDRGRVTALERTVYTGREDKKGPKSTDPTPGISTGWTEDATRTEFDMKRTKGVDRANPDRPSEFNVQQLAQEFQRNPPEILRITQVTEFERGPIRKKGIPQGPAVQTVVQDRFNGKDTPGRMLSSITQRTNGFDQDAVDRFTGDINADMDAAANDDDGDTIDSGTGMMDGVEPGNSSVTQTEEILLNSDGKIVFRQIKSSNTQVLGVAGDEDDNKNGVTVSEGGQTVTWGTRPDGDLSTIPQSQVDAMYEVGTLGKNGPKMTSDAFLTRDNSVTVYDPDGSNMADGNANRQVITTSGSAWGNAKGEVPKGGWTYEDTNVKSLEEDDGSDWVYSESAYKTGSNGQVAKGAEAQILDQEDQRSTFEHIGEFVKNGGLSIIGGVIAATGLVLGVLTSWTGVGAVAGGAMMMAGVALATADFGIQAARLAFGDGSWSQLGFAALGMIPGAGGVASKAAKTALQVGSNAGRATRLAGSARVVSGLNTANKGAMVAGTGMLANDISQNGLTVENTLMAGTAIVGGAFGMRATSQARSAAGAAAAPDGVAGVPRTGVAPEVPGGLFARARTRLTTTVDSVLPSGLTSRIGSRRAINVTDGPDALPGRGKSDVTPERVAAKADEFAQNPTTQAADDLVDSIRGLPPEAQKPVADAVEAQVRSGSSVESSAPSGLGARVLETIRANLPLPAPLRSPPRQIRTTGSAPEPLPAARAKAPDVSAVDASPTGIGRSMGKASLDIAMSSLAKLGPGAKFLGRNGKMISMMMGAAAPVLADVMPQSWREGLIDFWNSGWRDTFIIGAVTVGAVVLMTRGSGAWAAAGTMGGASGALYFGGERLTRYSEISLQESTGMVYVPGLGYVDPDSDFDAKGNITTVRDADGNPIEVSEDDLKSGQSQVSWAMSNFERDPATGALRARSDMDILTQSALEGAEGFVVGGTAALGAGGGNLLASAVGQRLVVNTGRALVGRTIAMGATESTVDLAASSVGSGGQAFFSAIANGQSLGEAFDAAGNATFTSMTSPQSIGASVAMVGTSIPQLKIDNVLDAAGRTQTRAVVDVTNETASEIGGGYMGAYGFNYVTARLSGMSHDEASARADAAGDVALAPENLVGSVVFNTAGGVTEASGRRQYPDAVDPGVVGPTGGDPTRGGAPPDRGPAPLDLPPLLTPPTQIDGGGRRPTATQDQTTAATPDADGVRRLPPDDDGAQTTDGTRPTADASSTDGVRTRPDATTADGPTRTRSDATPRTTPDDRLTTDAPRSADDDLEASDGVASSEAASAPVTRAPIAPTPPASQEVTGPESQPQPSVLPDVDSPERVLAERPAESRSVFSRIPDDKQQAALELLSRMPPDVLADFDFLAREQEVFDNVRGLDLWLESKTSRSEVFNADGTIDQGQLLDAFTELQAARLKALEYDRLEQVYGAQNDFIIDLGGARNAPTYVNEVGRVQIGKSSDILVFRRSEYGSAGARPVTEVEAKRVNPGETAGMMDRWYIDRQLKAAVTKVKDRSAVAEKYPGQVAPLTGMEVVIGVDRIGGESTKKGLTIEVDPAGNRRETRANPARPNDAGARIPIKDEVNILDQDVPQLLNGKESVHFLAIERVTIVDRSGTPIARYERGPATADDATRPGSWERVPARPDLASARSDAPDARVQRERGGDQPDRASAPVARLRRLRSRLTPAAKAPAVRRDSTDLAADAKALAGKLQSFRSIVIDVTPRGGYGDVAAGYTTAMDMVGRVGYQGELRLVTSTEGLGILSAMSGRQVAHDTVLQGPRESGTIRVLDRSRPFEGAPADLYLAMAWQDADQQAAPPVPTTGDAVAMWMPAFSGSESPRGTAVVQGKATELPPPGPGTSDAGVYASPVALQLRGKDPAQVRKFLRDSLETVQSPRTREALIDLVEGTRLQGSKRGVSYRARQFSDHVPGLVESARANGTSYTIIASDPSDAGGHQGPYEGARFIDVRRGETLPVKAEPGVVYVVGIDSVPETVDVALLADSEIPPHVAGDGPANRDLFARNTADLGLVTDHIIDTADDLRPGGDDVDLFEAGAPRPLGDDEAPVPPPALAWSSGPLGELDPAAALGDSPRDPGVFRAVPTSNLDPSYYQNQVEAAESFNRYLFGAEPITGQSLAAATGRMQAIAALGIDGDRPYQVYRTVDGERVLHYSTDQAKMQPGQWRKPGLTSRGRRPNADQYAREIKSRHGNDPASLAPRVDGVHDHHQGIETFYPDAEFMAEYFEVAARRLDEVMSLPPGSPAWRDALADYYHTLINARPYVQINQSIFITQINTILIPAGYRNGIQAQGLDHLAHRSSTEEFRAYFAAHLEGTLPSMADFGLGSGWKPGDPVATPEPRAPRQDIPAPRDGDPDAQALALQQELQGKRADLSPEDIENRDHIAISQPMSRQAADDALTLFRQDPEAFFLALTYERAPDIDPTSFEVSASPIDNDTAILVKGSETAVRTVDGARPGDHIHSAGEQRRLRSRMPVADAIDGPDQVLLFPSAKDMRLLELTGDSELRILTHYKEVDGNLVNRDDASGGEFLDVIVTEPPPVTVSEFFGPSGQENIYAANVVHRVGDEVIGPTTAYYRAPIDPDGRMTGDYDFTTDAAVADGWRADLGEGSSEILGAVTSRADAIEMFDRLGRGGDAAARVYDALGHAMPASGVDDVARGLGERTLPGGRTEYAQIEGTPDGITWPESVTPIAMRPARSAAAPLAGADGDGRMLIEDLFRPENLGDLHRAVPIGSLAPILVRGGSKDFTYISPYQDRGGGAIGDHRSGGDAGHGINFRIYNARRMGAADGNPNRVYYSVYLEARAGGQSVAQPRMVYVEIDKQRQSYTASTTAPLDVSQQPPRPRAELGDPPLEAGAPMERDARFDGIDHFARVDADRDRMAELDGSGEAHIREIRDRLLGSEPVDPVSILSGDLVAFETSRGLVVTEATRVESEATMFGARLESRIHRVFTTGWAASGGNGLTIGRDGDPDVKNLLVGFDNPRGEEMQAGYMQTEGELGGGRDDRMWRISPEDAAVVARYRPAAVDPVYPGWSRAEYTGYAALQGLQYRRWLRDEMDVESRGHADIRRDIEDFLVDDTRENYGRALDTLIARLGADDFARAATIVFDQHLSGLHAHIHNDTPYKPHSDIAPLTQPATGIAAQAIRQVHPITDDMSESGHLVNAKTLFGDADFWTHVRDNHPDVFHRLVDWIQAQPTDLSQAPALGKRVMIHPVALVQQHFPAAFDAIHTARPDFDATGIEGLRLEGAEPVATPPKKEADRPTRRLARGTDLDLPAGDLGGHLILKRAPVTDIVGELGSGNLHRVLEARDQRGTRFAVKVGRHEGGGPLPDRRDPTTVDRDGEAMQALAAYGGPQPFGQVRVPDGDGGWLPGYAMELIDGVALEDVGHQDADAFPITGVHIDSLHHLYDQLAGDQVGLGDSQEWNRNIMVTPDGAVRPIDSPVVPAAPDVTRRARDEIAAELEARGRKVAVPSEPARPFETSDGSGRIPMPNFVTSRVHERDLPKIIPSASQLRELIGAAHDLDHATPYEVTLDGHVQPAVEGSGNPPLRVEVADVSERGGGEIPIVAATIDLFAGDDHLASANITAIDHPTLGTVVSRAEETSVNVARADGWRSPTAEDLARSGPVELGEPLPTSEVALDAARRIAAGDRRGHDMIGLDHGLEIPPDQVRVAERRDGSFAVVRVQSSEAHDGPDQDGPLLRYLSTFTDPIHLSGDEDLMLVDEPAVLMTDPFRDKLLERARRGDLSPLGIPSSLTRDPRLMVALIEGGHPEVMVYAGHDRVLLGDAEVATEALDADPRLLQELRPDDHATLEAMVPDAVRAAHARLDVMDRRLAELDISLARDRVQRWSVLEELVRNRTTDGEGDNRPVAMVIFPKHDWNDAFQHNPIDELSRTYRVMYYEAGSVWEVIGAHQDSLEHSQGPLEVIVLGAHGTQKTMTFGDETWRNAFTQAHRLRTRDRKKLEQAAFGATLVDGGFLVLDSCSTGEGGEGAKNMANVLSEVVPQANVHAPHNPTNMDLVYGDDGRVEGAHYFQDDEHYQVPPTLKSLESSRSVLLGAGLAAAGGFALRELLEEEREEPEKDAPAERKARPAQQEERKPRPVPLDKLLEGPWRELGLEGVRLLEVDGVTMLAIDLDNPLVDLMTNSEQGPHQLAELAESLGAQIAINGDLFNFANYVTTGLARADGKDLFGSEWVKGGQAMFGFGGDRVAILSPYGRPPKWAENIVSGRPIIVENGVPITHYESWDEERLSGENGRSAAGLSEGGRVLYLATSGGIDTADLARLLARQGVKDALAFDGSGSAQMYVDGEMLEPGDGRDIANAILVRTRRSR